VAIVSEFLDWLDDGPAPATNLADNMRTAGMIFGAIEAARIGQAVDVEHMLADAGVGGEAGIVLES
jgi:hypothetical protein